VWERPDAFSRVYACSGSFVAFRGGHEFPTLIRKFEAKPIRAYLTTGTNDMDNCAGNWFLLDQEMDKALTFSGYDHLFQIISGGHGAGWKEHFPAAMRYLWKGWPEPVPAGQSAPRVRDVLQADDKWELAAQGYHEAGSPAGNSAGEVFFADTATDKIYRLGLDGKVEVFLANAGQANGLCIGPKDELYTVSRHSGNIMCYDRSGQGRVVADGIHGNEILARPDGSLYVTTTEEKAGGTGQVWLVKDGRKTLVDSGGGMNVMTAGAVPRLPKDPPGKNPPANRQMSREKSREKRRTHSMRSPNIPSPGFLMTSPISILSQISKSGTDDLKNNPGSFPVHGPDCR